ncbi:interferon-induced very large GTPase 1-like [Brachyhypopomus gauderio]|uniref:interferon-induced very large GTPase 1-like n=1 Tax=Brachyhypopomus gauderio TaxID=698409 RepID=UPI0040416508
MSIDQQLTEVDSKKNKIRKAQQKESRNLNNFMTQFCKYALARTETNERIAMLNWLRKFLDDAFTGVVTDLQEQYHTTWTDTRKDTTEEDIKVQLLHHLKVISEKIKSASFKVHHIMREIAQIYEAVCSSQESRAVCGFEVDRLPEFGAEIMMSGLAIELLDGDANHIPLKWISAVLDKLIQNIKDQRVFVISVLGLQSSGKSTLLNVLFGLQFAVSAGRCTKGAFMQLVPVQEELRDQQHFDYVLLVDTEGLQSVEADASLTHDNELATFVVGLGDVTIINVMGENTAEIQNILPICFQAFLRMASVEIKPRCFLVQQNITETAAKDKTQEGRRQLISKLDEMSKIAAEAEDREVTGFSDIIQFDAETHVFYFKNYFDGDPPMAPPKPSYTQNAQELKTKLLSIAKMQDSCKPPLISELRTRIQHLWNALMKENFVFHFKNALQYMVYSKLEQHYGTWSWKLRKHALETQNTLHYKIISNESHDTPTGQFKQDFDSIYQDIKVEVDKYFREEKYPEILVQWRNSIDKRLETLNTELIEETYAIERELINMKTYRLELDQRRRKYEADLLQKSKNLATQIKTEKLSEEELYVQFNTMWTEWENRVAAEKPQKNPRNIQAEVEKVLEICFQKFWNIIFPIKEEPCCNVDGIVKDSCKRFLRSLEKLMIFELASQRVQDGIEQILAKRDKENFGINDNFIHHMVSEINSMIEQYEKSSGIQFIGVIKAQIAVNACIKAVKNLKTLNENFIRTHDPLIYFNSKKEEYFNLFKHVFEGATSVTFFVRYLVNYLQTAVQDAVTKKLCIDIVGDLKSNLPAFTGNRSKLENYILKYLAEKEKFDLYVKYIHEPQNVLKMFITEHTEMYLSDKTKMERMVRAAWSSFIKPIISNSNLATIKLVEIQGNVNASAWLDEFCGKLSRHMAISRMDLKNIEKEDLQDPDFFNKHFAERLKLAIDSGSKKHTEQFTSGPMLFRFTSRPDDILFKLLNGCWEQCPFCKAVCTNTIPDHDCDHSVHLHRPQVLGNVCNKSPDPADEYWPESPINTEKQFFLKFCTSVVKSSYKFFSAKSESWVSFREYRQAGPPYDRWNIQDHGSEGLYWKWFICTFRAQLEEFYGGKFEGCGEIPKEWEEITKMEALSELNIMDSTLCLFTIY